MLHCANFIFKKMSGSRTSVSQSGAVLIIALIALVAMTLAGIALMRSVDTANVIAGNFAFKETTLHAADLGAEQAFSAITTTTTGLAANGSTAVTPDSAHPYYYFPVMQALDPQTGVPTTVNWKNSALGYTHATNAVIPTGYTVQYAVERECAPVTDATGNVTKANGPDPTSASEIAGFCITAPIQGGAGGSKNSDAVSFTKSETIYYRVTVRVTGPHTAVSMVQSTVSL